MPRLTCPRNHHHNAHTYIIIPLPEPRPAPSAPRAKTRTAYVTTTSPQTPNTCDIIFMKSLMESPSFMRAREAPPCVRVCVRAFVRACASAFKIQCSWSPPSGTILAIGSLCKSQGQLPRPPRGRKPKMANGKCVQCVRVCACVRPGALLGADSACTRAVRCIARCRSHERTPVIGKLWSGPVLGGTLRARARSCASGAYDVDWRGWCERGRAWDANADATAAVAARTRACVVALVYRLRCEGFGLCVAVLPAFADVWTVSKCGA